MNNENLKKFYELLKADKALAEELQNAVNATVLQFAAKQGLAFTAEELAEYKAEPRELTEEELAQVNAAGNHPAITLLYILFAIFSNCKHN